ncbi:MAG: hypothetical protein RJA70_4057 [Pseudomonadota bacterium]
MSRSEPRATQLSSVETAGSAQRNPLGRSLSSRNAEHAHLTTDFGRWVWGPMRASEGAPTPLTTKRREALLDQAAHLSQIVTQRFGPRGELTHVAGNPIDDDAGLFIQL